MGRLPGVHLGRLANPWNPHAHPRDSEGRFIDTPGIPDQAAPTPPVTQHPNSPLFRARRRPLTVAATTRARAEYLNMSPVEQNRRAAPVTSIASSVDSITARLGPRPEGPARTTAKARLAAAAQQGLIDQDVADDIDIHAVDLSDSLTSMGVPEDAVAEATTRFVDILVAQELESWARPSTAHGARHALADADLASSLAATHPGLRQPGGKPTPALRAEALWTGALHDLGYLTPPARLGYSGHHEKHGKAYYDKKQRDFTTGLFGRTAATRIGYNIATHRNTDLNLDGDPITTSFRTADNLAIFSPQKTPPLVKVIPDSLPILQALHDGQIDEPQTREALHTLIDNAALEGRISPVQALQLHAAADDATTFQHELVGSLVSGQVTSATFTDDGRLDIHLARTPAFDPVTALFGNAMGERGFRRFAKDHGGDPDALMRDDHAVINGMTLTIDDTDIQPDPDVARAYTASQRFVSNPSYFMDLLSEAVAGTLVRANPLPETRGDDPNYTVSVGSYGVYDPLAPRPRRDYTAPDQPVVEPSKTPRALPEGTPTRRATVANLRPYNDIVTDEGVTHIVDVRDNSDGTYTLTTDFGRTDTVNGKMGVTLVAGDITRWNSPQTSKYTPQWQHKPPAGKTGEGVTPSKAPDFMTGRTAVVDADGRTRMPERGKPWGQGYPEGDPRTDPAYHAYHEATLAAAQRAIDNTGDTVRVHGAQVQKTGSDGKPRTEWAITDEARQDFDTKLLAHAYAQVEAAGVPRDHKAIVMAGPPGAGKSTALGKATELGIPIEVGPNGDPVGFAVVNPDMFKEAIVAQGGLPEEYKALYGLEPGECASLLHEESSILAERFRTTLLANGYNVVLDGTLAGNPTKQQDKISQLRELGYDVQAFLVNAPLIISKQRAAHRHMSQPPQTDGGHYTGRMNPMWTIDDLAKVDADGNPVSSRLLKTPTGKTLSKAQANFEQIAQANGPDGQPLFNAGWMAFDTGNHGTAVAELLDGSPATISHTGTAWDHPETVNPVLPVFADPSKVPPDATERAWARAVEITEAAMGRDETALRTLGPLVASRGDGVQLADLHKRLKALPSTARVVGRRMLAGEDPESVTIPDALRFTVVSARTSPAGDFHDIIDGLTQAGWTRKKYDPDGNSPNVMSGLGTWWSMPDGTDVEIQFHTPSSRAVRERTVIDRQIAQDPSRTATERQLALARQMSEVAPFLAEDNPITLARHALMGDDRPVTSNALRSQVETPDRSPEATGPPKGPIHDLGSEQWIDAASDLMRDFSYNGWSVSEALPSEQPYMPYDDGIARPEGTRWAKYLITVPPGTGGDNFGYGPPAGGMMNLAVTPDGDLIFESLLIDDRYQGKGVGTALEDYLRAMTGKEGFREVVGYADAEIGGYVWAARGWDWKDGPPLAEFRSVIDGKVKQGGHKIPDSAKQSLEALMTALEGPNPPSPRQVAQWGSDQTWKEWGYTMWPGKALLMNSDYPIRLPLGMTDG